MSVCDYIKICPDRGKLEDSINSGRIDEDLADQAENLCENPDDFCSIRNGIKLIYILNAIRIKKQNSEY